MNFLEIIEHSEKNYLIHENDMHVKIHADTANARHVDTGKPSPLYIYTLACCLKNLPLRAFYCVFVYGCCLQTWSIKSLRLECFGQIYL